KFKDAEEGSYAVQVQAAYIDTSKSSNNKTSSQKSVEYSVSGWTDQSLYVLKKGMLRVIHLSGALKTCLVNAGYTDINPLHVFTKVDCRNSGLQNSDILQIEDFTNLQSLIIDNNPAVTDISPLANLPYLSLLSMEGNTNINLTYLSEIIELKDLYLGSMGLTAIPNLKDHKNLDYLDLSNNQISTGFDMLPISLIVLDVKGVNTPTLCQIIANNSKEVDSLAISGDSITTIEDCAEIIGLRYISVSDTTQLSDSTGPLGNSTANGGVSIDSFSGFCGLAFNNTNLKELKGSRPIQYLSLINNHELSQINVIKQGLVDSANDYPNLIPRSVIIQGSDIMDCDTWYNRKSLIETLPFLDMKGISVYTKVETRENISLEKNSLACPMTRELDYRILPNTCRPAQLNKTNISVYKDPYRNKYRFNWLDEQTTVTDYQLMAMDENGNQLGNIRQLGKSTPLPLFIDYDLENINPSKFKLRACLISAEFPSGMCGSWSDDLSYNNLPARAIYLKNHWAISTNSTWQHITFKYPVEHQDANLENNAYFKLSLRLSSDVLPHIAFSDSEGTGESLHWRSDQFPDARYEEDTFYVKTCINDSVSGDEICGLANSVYVDTRPINGSSLDSPSAHFSCDSNGDINLGVSYHGVNEELVDYFKVRETQPVFSPYGPEGRETEITYYLEKNSSGAAGISLRRLVNGAYSFIVAACQRDRKNGDVCSIYRQAGSTQGGSVCNVNRSLGVVAPTELQWYEQDGDSNKKVIKWSYAGTTKPDYFYIKKSSVTQQNQQNTNGISVDACIDQRTMADGTTVYNYSKYEFSHYIANEEHNMTNVPDLFNDDEYWSTRGLCHDGIKIDINSNDNNWNVYACQNGIGCSAPANIDLTGSGQVTLPNIPNPLGAGNTANAVGGPANLDPGVFWNPYQSGTGWHFYWVNHIKGLSDTQTLASPFDLKAYWFTYREIEGEWSPVWITSDLKQSSIGNNEYKGYLMYSYIDGSTIVEDSIGAIELKLDPNDNSKATVWLEVDYDGNLFTQNQVNYDSVGLDVPTDYEIHDDGNISIPIEDFSIRIVGNDPARFGNDNNLDHYTGAWENYPSNVNNKVTFLEWIKKDLEFSGTLFYDNQGQPLWVVSSSCGDPCDEPLPGWFPSTTADGNSYTVTKGFNPLGYADLDYNVSNNVVNVANVQRKLDYQTTGIIGSKYNNLQFNFNINISGLSNENDLMNRATSINLSNEEFTKTANVHSIEYFMTNTDGTEVVEGNTCNPNDANTGGECIIHFNWFTTDDFPNVKAYYKKDGGDLLPLADLCGETFNDTDPYNEFNYQCLILEEGIYQFELGKANYDNSSQVITIAESETLDIVSCTTALCGEQLDPPAAAIDIPNDYATSVSQQGAITDTVGTTSGVFDIDESGAANYSLPIFAPAGRGGLSPQLALSYNSSSGNGIAGVGWNISGISSITRCLKSPEHDPDLDFYPAIQMNNTDALCLDGQRLFNQADGSYRTEIDSFSRITTIDTAGNGPSRFKVETKSGEIRIYGSDGASFKANKIFTTGGTGPQIISNDGVTVHTWLLNKIQDKNGNNIYFVWDTFEGESYLSHVKWTNPVNGDHHYQIDFEYSDSRTDAKHHYDIGTEYKAYRNLEYISTLIRETPATTTMQEVRRLKLNYENIQGSAPSGMLRLASVEQCLNSGTCLQPVEFEWDNNNTQIGFATVTQTSTSIATLSELGKGGFKPIDVNGDGIKELLFVRNYDDGNPLFEGLEAKYSLAVHYVSDSSPVAWASCTDTGSGYWNRICNYNIKPFDLADDRVHFDSGSWFVYDYNGDGKEDLLTPYNGSWQILYSNGSAISTVGINNTLIPFETNSNSAVRASFILDLSNDGLPDLVTPVNDNNVYKFKIFKGHIGSNGLTYSYNFVENINLDVNVNGILQNVELGVADFNGDGYSDAIIRYSVLGTGQGECDATTQSQTENGLPSPTDIDCETFYYGMAEFVPESNGVNAQLSMVKSLGIYDFIYLNDSRGQRQIESGTLRYIDINGDGLTDMVYGTYLGGDDYYWRGIWAYRLNVGTFDENNLWEFGDENTFNLSQVLGEDQCQIGDDLCDSKLVARREKTQFMDYDLDGDIDILYASSTGSANDYNYKLSKYNINTAYSVHEDTTILAWNADNNAQANNYINVFLDFTGDGNSDYFQLYRGVNNKKQSFSYGKGVNKPKNKITKITNILKTKQTHIDIEYKVATDPVVYTKSTGSFQLPAVGNGSPIFDIFVPSYLVQSVAKTSPGFAPTVMEYKYAGLKVQGGGRGSLGFALVSTFDERHHITTETSYKQDFPFIGMPETTIAHYNDGTISRTISDSISSYLSNTTTVGDVGNVHKTYFPYLSNSIEREYAANTATSGNGLTIATTPQKTIVNDFVYNINSSYPSYGNLLSSDSMTYSGSASSGTASLVEQKLTSNSYFTDNTSNWILARLKQTTVTSKRKVNGVLTEKSRTSSFVYDTATATGQLTEELIHGTNDEKLLTVHEYDTYGQEKANYQCSYHFADKAACITTPVKARPKDASYIHRYSKIDYDTLWGEYVEKTWSPFTTYSNSFNTSIHAGDDYFTELDEGLAILRNTTIISGRDIYGNPRMVTDMHGNKTATAYSSFGEALVTATSLGSKSTTNKAWCTSVGSPQYCPSNASIMVTNTPIVGAKSKKYLDVMGREVRSQAQDFIGNWTTVDTSYDRLGRTVQQSEPYTRLASNNATNTQAYYTSTEYDDLDRVVKIISPTRCIEDVSDPTRSCTNEAIVTTTSYQNLNVATTNPRGQTTTQYFDVSGKITSSKDAKNVSVYYEYDANGNLNKTSGPLSIITMTYDDFGRKKTMDDPDKGNWTYKYNALGEKREQSNINSNEKAYYDIRGRMFYRSNSDEVSLWEYDSIHDGLLASEYSVKGYIPNSLTNIAQIKHFTYDSLKRPSLTTNTIYDGEQSGSHSYSTEITYDEYGRVFQSFDATGNGVMNEYNTYGFKYLTRDAANGINGQVYHEVLNTDSRGNVISEKYYDTFYSYKSHEPQTGFLKNIITNTGGITVQDLSYGFDEIGNLIRRTDFTVRNNTNNDNITETFDYDDLNRLKNEYLDYIATPEARYFYDSSGNLTQKDGLVLNYAQTGNAGPHAVTSTVDNTYYYDTVGNVTSRIGTDPATFAYTSFDKPHTIVANGWQAEIAYGASRSRYIRKDIKGSSRITHYLGSVEYIYENGTTRAKRYIGNLVINIDEDSDSRNSWDFRFLLKDHIGSTHTIVDRFGNASDNMSFNAWGQRRVPPVLDGEPGHNYSIIPINTVWTQLGASIDDSTNRGFTGHEHFDQVGIIHMNGRIYDPTIGRFLQADPIIQDPYNTQSLNRYSYVMNNPLSHTDPTGYSRLRKGWWRAPLAIAVMFIPGAQGFGVIFLQGMLSGAIATGNLKGAVKGGIQAALTYGIAHGSGGDGWIGASKNGGFNYARSFAHAAVGGVSAEVDGGKFGHGFVTAGIMKGVGKIQTSVTLGRALIQAIAGGT
ncbi:MAG: hypothetical protein JKY19_08645, partial [Alcanivoracaceae bacterium]|nr:hypothetical protein [Alcanivoracaceae bacterium]